MSTEATVRGVIAEAIREIATTKLGFGLARGNVREYPLDFHQDEDPPGYLMAEVGSNLEVRCWAVNVIGREVPLAMNNVWQRIYTIEVIGYYGKGKDGEGYLAAIDGATAVRGAIRDLGSNLSGTVDLVTTASEPQIDERDEHDVGKFWQLVMNLTAERANPAFP